MQVIALSKPCIKCFSETADYIANNNCSLSYQLNLMSIKLVPWVTGLKDDEIIE